MQPFSFLPEIVPMEYQHNLQHTEMVFKKLDEDYFLQVIITVGFFIIFYAYDDNGGDVSATAAAAANAIAI